MRRRRFLASTLVLGAAGLATPGAGARRLFPAGITDRYVVRQGEKAVGRQEFVFRRGADGFTVESSVGMRFVSPELGETTYEHEAREVWGAGWLQRLESHTRIGAVRKDVRATREAGSLRVSGSEIRSFQFTTYVVPSNLWHRDSRLVEAFIDVESGRLISSRPRYAGKQRLRQGGGEVEAHHYTLRGQLERDAWYDADCVLVRWDLLLAGDGRLSFRREAP